MKLRTLFHATICGLVLLLGTMGAVAQTNSYQQTNLVSDMAGAAAHTDHRLINPWGIAFVPGQPFWVAEAKNEGRTIIFIDESGLSERPHRCRTWAPRGQTPVLQYHFNWKTLSAMAGVTWWNFYFRLFPGTIRSPQIIEFLSHLMRHIPGSC